MVAGLLGRDAKSKYVLSEYTSLMRWSSTKSLAPTSRPSSVDEMYWVWATGALVNDHAGQHSCPGRQRTVGCSRETPGEESNLGRGMDGFRVMIVAQTHIPR